MRKKSPARFFNCSKKKNFSRKAPEQPRPRPLLNRKTPNHGKKLGVLVSAGNIDVSLLSLIIRRGLVKDGRLVRLRIHLPDHPGALQKLAGVIADQKANIVETMYDRAYYGVVLGDAVIDITMETRGPEHVADLTAALDASGYTFERVQ